MSIEYVYTPLEADEIRLLEVHAGDDDSDLHGSLHTFRLPVDDEPANGYEVFLTRSTGFNIPNAPPYDALSYVWGSAVRLRHHIKILQDGKLRYISLRPNLFEALRRLRKEIARDGTKMLWADSICINQVSFRYPLHDSNVRRRLIYLRTTFSRRTHRFRRWR
jgi:hypothetical protein